MHAVERKLRYEMLPYLVTAQRLKAWPPMRIYATYLYAAELFVLLAGFGVATPVMRFLSGNPAGSGDAKQQTIVEFLGSGYMAFLSLVLLVIWGLLKFYVKTEDLPKKCNLLQSCISQCAGFGVQIRRAVADPNPMPTLIVIQAKLSDLVERNVAEGAWPYDGPEPGIQSLVDQQYEDLVAPFRGNWNQIDADTRA